MHQHASLFTMVYTDPSMRNTVATLASVEVAMVLALVACRCKGICYIEWPFDEPMVNVIALMRSAEEGGLVFDASDPDLWEEIDGGYRLHGMFLEDVIGEEAARGVSPGKRTICTEHWAQRRRG